MDLYKADVVCIIWKCVNEESGAAVCDCTILKNMVESKRHICPAALEEKK